MHGWQRANLAQTWVDYSMHCGGSCQDQNNIVFDANPMKVYTGHSTYTNAQHCYNILKHICVHTSISGYLGYGSPYIFDRQGRQGTHQGAVGHHAGDQGLLGTKEIPSICSWENLKIILTYINIIYHMIYTDKEFNSWSPQFQN